MVSTSIRSGGPRDVRPHRRHADRGPQAVAGHEPELGSGRRGQRGRDVPHGAPAAAGTHRRARRGIRLGRVPAVLCDDRASSTTPTWLSSITTWRAPHGCRLDRHRQRATAGAARSRRGADHRGRRRRSPLRRLCTAAPRGRVRPSAPRHGRPARHTHGPHHGPSRLGWPPGLRRWPPARHDERPVGGPVSGPPAARRSG
jgi:hypothetical protein